MMPTTTIYFLVILELSIVIPPCQAEVRLIHDTLTVNIHNTTMKDALNELRHQADLNIVAFEETQISKVRISKTFWNLPLEEGLDRLLSGWNYGISRNASTGKIVTLYLVSQRTDSSALPVPLPSSMNVPSSRNIFESWPQPSFLDDSDENSESQASAEEEEDDGFATDQNFPSEEKLEHLPPDLREHLEKLYRENNGET